MIQELDNYLSETEFLSIQEILFHQSAWSFSGQSTDDADPSFWYLSLEGHIELLNIFKKSIANKFGFHNI